jgi:hypothetical protein
MNLEIGKTYHLEEVNIPNSCLENGDYLLINKSEDGKTFCFYKVENDKELILTIKQLEHINIMEVQQ